MAKDSGERPQSALTFGRELQEAQRSHRLAQTDLSVAGEPPRLGDYPQLEPPTADPGATRVVTDEQITAAGLAAAARPQDDQGSPWRRRLWWVLAALVAGGIAVVAAILALGGDGLVEIPDVSASADPVADLVAVGFAVTERAEFDLAVPSGGIVGSSPLPGDRVAEGAQVDVVFSLGPLLPIAFPTGTATSRSM